MQRRRARGGGGGGGLWEAPFAFAFAFACCLLEAMMAWLWDQWGSDRTGDSAV
jgi:hypothetical protein